MAKLTSPLDVKTGTYLKYKFDPEGNGVLVKKVLEANKEFVRFEGTWVGYGDLKQVIEITKDNVNNWEKTK